MKAVFAYEHELTRGALLIDNKAVFVCGDANAHEIRLTLKNNGVNAQLEGWDCQAYCVLNNRATAYSEEASLEGNVVSVTFPGSFYAMAGDTLVILRMLKEDAKIDLLYFMYTVRPGITSTVYDPSGELPDLSDFQAAISACDAAKKAANDAAGTANASAENAEAQAAAARSAADKAYKSASAADDAAADAILAAGDADDATDAANQAAATANAAAQRVEDAIDGAADAADAANAAAALVDAAIAASEQATQGAQASAAAATQAAQEAEAKAALADAAAQGAEASAGEADAAAGRANAAAESIEGLTISESVVEYGAGVSASVEKNPETGAYHIEIQTQRGPKGDPGEDYKILGPAYLTVEELALNVLNPEVGDQYNVGISAPYHVYRWTGSEWEDQGTIQGPAGTDAPQINDDEALETNPWSGLKTKEEIEKVEGRVYPCTATVLEGMSTADLVGIYNQGYRAIRTKNNETVVTLALASDGSLSWQGCNEDTANLLDNPNFAIAQAGYGGMHGSQIYAADRWMGLNTASAQYADGMVNVTDDGTGNCAVVQAMDSGEGGEFTVNADITPPSGGKWQIVVFNLETGTPVIISSSSGNETKTPILNVSVPPNIKIWVALYPTVNAPGSMGIVGNARLLRGSYSAKTLPPWESTNYSVEMIKCQYCYRRDLVSHQACAPTAGFPGFSYPAPMRVNPTVIIYDEIGNAGYISTWGQHMAYKVTGTPATRERLYYVQTEIVPQTVVSCVYLVESIADP